MEGLVEHEILVGTYEAYLLAYRIVKSESVEGGRRKAGSLSNLSMSETIVGQ